MKRIPSLAATVLLVVFCFFFNRDLVDYRVFELDTLLGRPAQGEESANTVNIVTRYKLIRNRIERGEREPANYYIEAMAVEVSPEKLFADRGSEQLKTVLPVGLLLQPLHSILGKPAPAVSRPPEHYELLETAYYWERNRGYAKAVEYYRRARLGEQPPSMEARAAILLHEGFCQSMLNDYEQAIGCFRESIHRYPETEAGILAWKLLDFLQTMQGRRNIIHSRRMDILEGAEQSYFLMEYPQAIVQLSLFLDSAPAGESIAEARYFLGRALEEQGDLDRAMSEYRQVMAAAPASAWAGPSARRLYMLGEYYGQQGKIDEETRQQISRRTDDAFFKSLGRFSASEFRNRLPRIAVVGPETAGPEGRSTGQEERASIPFDLRDFGVNPPEDETLTLCLDGEQFGRYDAARLPPLPPGRYSLELRGDGIAAPLLYGHVNLTLGEKKLVAVEVERLPYGAIEYRIPEESDVTLVGSQLTEHLAGVGRLSFVPAGRYRIEAASDRFQSFPSELEVGDGEQVVLAPQLSLREDRPAVPDVAAGTAVAWPEMRPGGLPGVSPGGLPGLSPTAMWPVLPGRDWELRADALAAGRDALMDRLQKEKERQKSLTTARWVSFGVGGLALGGLATFMYLGNQSYHSYQQANYTADAVALREQTEVYQALAIASGALAGAGVAGGVVFWALNPDTRSTQRQLDRLNEEISILGAK